MAERDELVERLRARWGYSDRSTPSGITGREIMVPIPEALLREAADRLAAHAAVAEEIKNAGDWLFRDGTDETTDRELLRTRIFRVAYHCKEWHRRLTAPTPQEPSDGKR